MTAQCIVLIVEDEALIRIDLVDKLARLGCTALEASSAAEAIAILERNREIMVVFTDVHMPGTMNGVQLAQYVRNRWPPTIIIVSSGKTLPAAGELAHDIAVLAKPYSETMLETVVADVRVRLNAIFSCWHKGDAFRRRSGYVRYLGNFCRAGEASPKRSWAPSRR
jgi:two-component system, response regulator PdtaR